MRIALLLLLILTIPCLPETMISSEKLGGFGVGSPVQDILAKLGEPDESLGPVPDPQSGDWVWDWSYPEQGVSIYVQGSSQDKPLRIRSISVGDPCPWSFSDQCGVGTALSEVKKQNPDLKKVDDGIWTVADSKDQSVRAYGIREGVVEQLYLGPKL